MYKTRSQYLQHAASQPRESAAEREAKKHPIDKVIKATPGGQTINVGSTVTGTVKRIENYGVFVSIDEINGLIHVSEISNKWVKHPSEFFKIGDKIKAIVTSLDIGKNRVNLSVKQLPDNQRNQ